MNIRVINFLAFIEIDGHYFVLKEVRGVSAHPFLYFVETSFRARGGLGFFLASFIQIP